MALPTYSIYLHCQHCDKVEFCNAENLVRRLRRVSMLRRNAEPDQELLRVLTQEAAGKFECGKCFHVGLSVSEEDPFDDQVWGDPVKCEVCCEIISPARMEVFPDTRLCTNCQSNEEQGETADQPDYCPRCGEIMVLRRRRGGGLAGYEMGCPACHR